MSPDGGGCGGARQTHGRRQRAAARRPGDRHDQSGGGPVLFDDPGRHGRGRDQGGAARWRRRRPPVRAAVRGRPEERGRRRTPQPVLRRAQPEQEERVRGLPAARGQDDRARLGQAVARAHRKLHTRHVGQVSDGRFVVMVIISRELV